MIPGLFLFISNLGEKNETKRPREQETRAFATQTSLSIVSSGTRITALRFSHDFQSSGNGWKSGEKQTGSTVRRNSCDFRKSRGQIYPTWLKLHQHPSISRGKKARGNSNLTLGGGENFHPPRCSGGRLIDDVAASRVSRGRLIVGIGDSGA